MSITTESIDILRRLSEALGVSGHEAPVREELRALVSPLADEVFTDRLGNLFARRAGKSERTLMLDAHMDEVGCVISHVDDNGFLRFDTLGGYDERILPGLPVLVSTDQGGCHRGVVGTIPPHILLPSDREKPIRTSDLFVDVGARNAEDVRALGICVGDSMVPDHPFEVLSDDVLMGKAFDDRVGCALLVEILKSVQGHELPVSVVFSFTVFEEVGARGAGPAAYRVNPDLALAVECTMAADTPGVPPERQPSRQGAGPAITVADRSVIVNRELVRALEGVARAEGIAVQYKKPLFGGTNAGPIHQVRSGVPTGVVSVPCRYIHAPCQMLRVSDYLATRSLLSAVVRDPRTLLEAVGTD